jgi:hypothetical protein
MNDVLTTVANRTTNDILLLMIVVAVVAILIAVPLYKVIAKASSERRIQELNREALILDVVKGNSAVMAELKSLLQESNDNCDNCRAAQLSLFKRLEDKQDAHTVLLTEIKQKV